MSKKLVIAEKPDLARNIAKNLKDSFVNKGGYLEGSEWNVTWVRGHMLELVPPEAYDPKLAHWKVEDLPILPQDWKLQARSGRGDDGAWVKKQIGIIKTLLKQCGSVVHAGDPDREGQLLVDELLEWLGNTKPVERVLINGTDPTTVQRALAALEDNKKYAALRDAAVGRQRSDWLVGMNLTRIFTVLAQQQHGFRGVLSVGRVQTPTLYLVVKRDLEIEAFKVRDFWLVHAEVAASSAFTAHWTPRPYHPAAVEVEEKEEEEARPDEKRSWVDSKARIFSEAEANRIVSETQAARCLTVVGCSRKPGKEKVPLPFDLNSLQARVIAVAGCSADDVMKAAQSLYDNGYLTYPRSGCRYLKESVWGDAGKILFHLASWPELNKAAASADPTIKGPVFNDAKVPEHHGIVPTLKPAPLAELPELESRVYQIVARRYIAQFYPDCEVEKAVIDLLAAGGRDGDNHYVARGKVIIAPGWRQVYAKIKLEEDKPKDGSETVEASTLPQVELGQKLSLQRAFHDFHHTVPPQRYTEGTLLKAMENIADAVSDPEEKKKLRALSGIGKPATRTGILKTLLGRKFLQKKGKHLVSTPLGRALVRVVPETLLNPGLTARWEGVLDMVATGKAPLEALMTRQASWVKTLITESSAVKVPAEVLEVSMGKDVKSKSRSSSAAKPAKPIPAGEGEKKCSKCGSAMRKRTAKQGANAGSEFWGCSNYPNCKHTEPVNKV